VLGPSKLEAVRTLFAEAAVVRARRKGPGRAWEPLSIVEVRRPAFFERGGDEGVPKPNT